MRFDELNLKPDIVKAINEIGFQEATAIQEKTIPRMQQGMDLIAQSETGSGKTAAFGLPVLEHLTEERCIQCLILVPTRELAEQVTLEMRRFSKHMKVSILSVYGGVAINPQIERLNHAQIVIATPGRLTDHINRRTINLRNLKCLVLDEADKMFEMGFVEDVRMIMEHCPRERQTVMFSATISSEIRDIANHYMHHPEFIKVGSYVDKGLLSQHYYQVDAHDKLSLLAHLIKQENPELSIVFCATRTRADSVAKNLQKNGINAYAIHGGHSQNRRNAIMKDFHSKSIQVLVATDVAARGLDIKDVTHIFNYDIPKTSKEYIHRIGRTARAGESGKAISLLAEADHENFRRVLEDRSLDIKREDLPEFPRLAFIMPRREQSQRRYSRGTHNRSYSGGGYGTGSRGGYGQREQRRSGYHQRDAQGHSRGYPPRQQRSSNYSRYSR